MILVSGCSPRGQSQIYFKYVFQEPVLIAPYKAVTNVDIWFARLRFRGLTRLTSSGAVELDLAKKIESKDMKNYFIELKHNLKFSNGKKINSTTIKEVLGALIEDSNLISIKVKELNVLTEYKFSIRLSKKSTNFLKELASHIYLIHDLKDPLNSSNVYVFNKKHKHFENFENSTFPAILKAVKVEENFQPDQNALFDTSLVPSSLVKSALPYLEYRVLEVWGLVLNLKNRFKNIVDRKCLDAKIPRQRIVTQVLPGHLPSSSFLGNLTERKCETNINFKIYIPKEIGQQGEKICRLLRSNNASVRCEYLLFSSILEKIKSGDFESALLSVTLEKPYVESLRELLSFRSNFSIINKEVKIPFEMENVDGQKFLRIFSQFIEDNAYFIPMSLPMRRIYGHNIDDYVPALTSSGYDGMENLAR